MGSVNNMNSKEVFYLLARWHMRLIGLVPIALAEFMSLMRAFFTHVACRTNHVYPSYVIHRECIFLIPSKDFVTLLRPTISIPFIGNMIHEGFEKRGFYCIVSARFRLPFYFSGFFFNLFGIHHLWPLTSIGHFTSIPAG